MQFVCQSEFLPGLQVTQLGPRRYALTTMVKATYELAPDGKVTVAEEQQFVTGDTPYPDDEMGAGAPRYASDFATWKPHADILLVGSCQTAPGQAETQHQVEFSVGDCKRRLKVYGHREWRGTLGLGKVPDAEPFERIELRYENSFGGEGFERNPVGKGFEKVKTKDGNRAWLLPNIEDPDHPVLSMDSRPEPAGFGPLPPGWPPRGKKTGTYDDRWKKTRSPGFPDDFDWSFFNAAPESQQVAGYLRGDERLEFVNLRADVPRFISYLPGIRSHCFVASPRDPGELRADIVGRNGPSRERLLPAEVIQRDGEYFYAIAMNIDTLWVDIDTQQLIVIWRGITPIRTDDYADIDYLYVTEDPLDSKRSLADYYAAFDDLRKRADDPEVMLAQVPGGLAAKLPMLPNIDTEMAKVEQKMAEVVSQSANADVTNSQLREAFGDHAPQLPALAGLALTAQMSALDDFMQSVSQTVQEVTDEKMATVRTELLAQGMDPDQPSPQQQAAEVELQQYIQDEGIDQQFQDADNTIREMARDAIRSGVPLTGLGVNIGALLLGIRGTGVDMAKLEAGVGSKIGTDPLTREDVELRLAANESFENVTLVELDLSGLDLSNRDFRDAVLVQVNLSGADLSHANFERAVLSEVDLTNAKLIKTQLSDANLAGSVLTNAELTEAVLERSICTSIKLNEAVAAKISAAGADFSESDLSQTRFDRSAMSGADFSKCTLDRTVFRRADLREAAFDEATGQQTAFIGADLGKVRASRGCKLNSAIFHQARMRESNWSHADLSNADFTNAKLAGAFFMEATLEAADFSSADLSGARLSKAQLPQAKLVKTKLFRTLLDKTNLREADLRGANAYGADFHEADMEDANLEDANLEMSIRS